MGWGGGGEKKVGTGSCVEVLGDGGFVASRGTTTSRHPDTRSVTPCALKSSDVGRGSVRKDL